MKKFLVLFIILSFGLSLLLVPGITYAIQTSLSNYYPSPNGYYTKVHLINPSTSGPNENHCFCAQISNDSATQTPTGSGYNSSGNCDIGENTAVYTYTNAGTIFADPTTGYLEICQSNGSVASYPGACFTRFSGSSVGGCPNNYQLAPNSSQSYTFSFNNVYSWSCCFTGQGAAPLSSTVPITKSGCFSTYSRTFSGGSSHPPYCNSVEAAANGSVTYVDSNAYDLGCENLGNLSWKRNCCFNYMGPMVGSSC